MNIRMTIPKNREQSRHGDTLHRRHVGFRFVGPMPSGQWQTRSGPSLILGTTVLFVGCSDGMDSSRFFRGRIAVMNVGRQPRNQEEAEMDATTVAVDLAKDIFEVALANRAGRIIERKRLTRRQFERFIDGLPAGTEVIMEACGTAHYWGRRCQARDLRVRLLPVAVRAPVRPSQQN